MNVMNKKPLRLIYGDVTLGVQGKEWIYRTPRPTFWRATTDNDRGNGFPLRSGMWLGADLFLKCKEITVCVDGQNIGLPELPVFGIRMIMPTQAAGFVYEGLSGETYPDRMAGGIPGTYEIKGLPVTPYLVPQDCGMHMDTRRVTVYRDTVLDNTVKRVEKTGITITQGKNPFAFSCLPYTAEELENATHQEELPTARRTVLCILGAVRGVGGIDSWGTDVTAPWHIDAEKDIAYDFYIE